MECNNIDHLKARTGYGLLINTDPQKRNAPYMGIEGHKQSESKEAGLLWNQTIDDDGKHKHIHDIEGNFFPRAKRGYHNSDNVHYDWNVRTLSPLYLAVKKSSAGVIAAEFVQILPKPTLMLKRDHERLKGNATLTFKHGLTYVHFLFQDPYHAVPRRKSTAKLYHQICNECMKIYYLYCEWVDLVNIPMARI